MLRGRILTVNLQGIGTDVVSIHIEQQPVRAVESDIPYTRRTGDPSQRDQGPDGDKKGRIEIWYHFAVEASAAPA